jgi:hypothetical protein
MAKSTQTQINDLKKRLEKQFGIIVTKPVMTKLGNFLVGDMQKRVRLGYGVPRQEGKRKSLKSMKPHTLAYTKFRQKKRSELDPTTSPRKQNLTFTGQLIRDLRVVKATKSNFLIGHSTSKRSGEKISNRQLSEFVQDKGRIYMNVSALEFKRLTRFYQNKIVRPVLSKV